MRKTAVLLSIAAFLLFMAGCGSQSSMVTETPPSPTAPATVPVSLTVTDTPPTGVTVLFFQLNITGASLAPGSVSLLPGTNPIPVNVTQLQTDSAFLATANVAAGTYTSLSLTFSNPQLTIFNGSGATVDGCANNAVCQLTPTAQSLSLTFNTAPFPVNLTANSPLAFVLDIHLNTVIQSDLSLNLAAANGVTIAQLPTPQSGAPISVLGHLIGTIQSINSTTSPNSFTLETGDGRTFNIDVNSSTTYNYPNSVCSTDTFSCLATQQIVKVEVSLQTGGTLLASEVDYVQPPGQTVVEGNILRLSTSNGNTIMDMILQGGPPAPAANALPFGGRATVTVPPTGVAYAVDHDSFTIPDGLTFGSASDLRVGQAVSVVATGTVTTANGSGNSTTWIGPGPITFTASGITLEPSQITGPILAINQGAMSFTLGTLPFFFVPAATTGATPTLISVGITVQTTSQTTYLNLTPDSFTGLQANDVVSVKGWLFPTPGAVPQVCTVNTGCPSNTTLAAEEVIGRLGPTPLF